MDSAELRTRMVDRHIRARGVRDDRVLAALRSVPREAFLPPELAEFAYEDRPAADRCRSDDLAALHRIDDAELDRLLERIGDARVVLLGEATHGTSEFYRMRTRITQQLILRHGFRTVAVEADWPDASAVDRYIRGVPARPRPWVPFSRFPTWMWRNREVQALIEWLRAYNLETSNGISFSGLDLYSMYTSAHEVVRYLEGIDPVAAQSARERYGRLTPWEDQ